MSNITALRRAWQRRGGLGSPFRAVRDDTYRSEPGATFGAGRGGRSDQGRDHILSMTSAAAIIAVAMISLLVSRSLKQAAPMPLTRRMTARCRPGTRCRRAVPPFLLRHGQNCCKLMFLSIQSEKNILTARSTGLLTKIAKNVFCHAPLAAFLFELVQSVPTVLFDLAPAS